MKAFHFALVFLFCLTAKAEVLTDKNGIVINQGDYLNLKFTDLVTLNNRIGNGHTKVTDSPTCKEKSLVVSINGNQVGSDGGFSSQQKLSQSFEDLYLSYTVKIGADFDFNSYLDDGKYSMPCNTNKQNCTLNTGKLFGLSGGDIETNWVTVRIRAKMGNSEQDQAISAFNAVSTNLSAYSGQQPYPRSRFVAETVDMSDTWIRVSV